MTVDASNHFPEKNTGLKPMSRLITGIREIILGGIVSDICPENIFPSNITQQQAEKFRELGLTYELSEDGYYICVYEDLETHQISKFIYSPQLWINDHAPQNVTWRRDGIILHEFGDGGHAWYFNKKKPGLTNYNKHTLASNHLRLATRAIVKKLAIIFQGDMSIAFGINLTSWSHPDGCLSLVNLDCVAALWFSDGCLGINRSGSWVDNGIRGFGCGLFLQII